MEALESTLALIFRFRSGFTAVQACFHTPFQMTFYRFCIRKRWKMLLKKSHPLPALNSKPSLVFWSIRWLDKGLNCQLAQNAVTFDHLVITDTDSFYFESRMSLSQHKRLNNILNQLYREVSHQYLRVNGVTNTQNRLTFLGPHKKVDLESLRTMKTTRWRVFARRKGYGIWIFTCLFLSMTSVSLWAPKFLYRLEKKIRCKWLELGTQESKTESLIAMMN